MLQLLHCWLRPSLGPGEQEERGDGLLKGHKTDDTDDTIDTNDIDDTNDCDDSHDTSDNFDTSDIDDTNYTNYTDATNDQVMFLVKEENNDDGSKWTAR